MLTLDQLNALNRFAKTHGRLWRSALRAEWLADKRVPRDNMKDHALLRQLRNTQAPEFVRDFQPIDGDFTRIGKIVKDHQERFTLKRAWYVNAWRVVDQTGRDILQPWFDSKGYASELAKKQGIFIEKATAC